MISRPYAPDDSDLPALVSFISRANQAVYPGVWDFQIGDLLWQRYLHEEQESRWFDRVQIWEDFGREILGFAIYYIGANELCPLIAPSHWESTEPLESMMTWAKDRAKIFHPETDKADNVVVSSFESTPMAAYLQSHGWTQADDAPMFMLGRSLDEVPSPQLPDGFEIRKVRDPEEIEARVAIHQEVFAPSKFSVTAYDAMRGAEGYDADLDLVAVDSSETLAAYCIAWYDPLNRSALFEPVGARESFRGRGLTKATLYEAMARVKQKGGWRMLVPCDSESESAVGLYRSVGFEEVGRMLFFHQHRPKST
jgi:mycothiol synthase